MKALRNFASSRRCNDLIVIAVVLEAFFLALSPLVAEASLLIGFLIYLFRWRMDRNYHYKKSPVFGAIAVFMVCGAASILVSPDRGFSFYNWYNLAVVYCMTFILVTQNVTTRDEIKAFPELRKRVFATWENPNILAAYLDIVICVLLGLFAKIKNKNTRIYLALFMVASLACLTMTYARGALLTIAVIIGCYGILKDRRILLALILVAGGVLALDPVLLERMQTAFLVADTSSEMRIAMWESTVQMIMDHPLLGIGWGAYWMVYPLYDTYIVDGSVTLVHAHNIYLNYWAEIGLIGGTAFLWYFFKTM